MGIGSAERERRRGLGVVWGVLGVWNPSGSTENKEGGLRIAKTVKTMLESRYMFKRMQVVKG